MINYHNSIERPFELDTNMIRKTQVDIKTALREAFVNMIIHARLFKF